MKRFAGSATGSETDMTSKIFKNILITCLATTIVIIGLFLTILYNNFKDDVMTRLKSDVGYLIAGIENEGMSYLDDLKISDRITYISRDGQVLFDNKSDEAAMDNHSGRDEIKEALINGEGQSERYSDTLGKVSLYYAKALSDGNIIRISTDTSTITALLLGMSSYIFWIVVIVLFVAVLIANRLASKIVKPINEIDLSSHNIISPYKELTPLFAKINEQNYTIIRQLSKLDQLKEEFKTVTDNMAEGIIVINREKKILSFNGAAVKLFGAADVHNGDNVFCFDHSLKFMSAIEEALKGRNAEYRLQSENRVYSVLINPVKIGEHINGASILIIDITAKEMQEKLRREFSANVSHELKTPLTSISGFAEIMKNGIVDPDDVADMAADIYDEAQRLIVLIDDIIRLSSLESNEIETQKENVDLKELTNEIFAHLSAAAAGKNISLICNGEGTIKGVRYILEEVIQNLVDNAIKYGNENGHVCVVIYDHDDQVIIKVTDDGIGIAEDETSRIFERFYRVDKSHSKAIGGTGLGLSIVKHGVEYHGGFTEVMSKPGIGTTFTVYLPKRA